MINDFFTMSDSHFVEQRPLAEMIAFQRILLDNYIAYLDSEELSGSDKHARKWKEKMIKEIKFINLWLKEQEKTTHYGQEHWL